MNENELLYIRYYERIDDSREMITKKYYDLEDDLLYSDEAIDHDDKIGDIWPLGVLLDDLESAARRK